jgi:cytochrome c oxidase cbb3-type subunit 3
MVLPKQPSPRPSPSGRQNKMPAWKEFLGDAKIHLLTAMFYSLSQGAK